MAVTILERPEGHILSTTANTATVSSSYGAGDAQFVSPTVHGLVDGNYIYAESDIEDYAGFWYVDVITTGIFKIKRYAAGDYVQFINDGSITWYQSDLKHGWSAVHLPITYRLSNNLYPDNTFDSAAPLSVTGVTDYNGYSSVHLSGGGISAVHTYDFVTLSNPQNDIYDGIFQILEFVSPNVIILNRAFNASDNFYISLPSDFWRVQKYYNNYNIIVRVYAGINAAHQWALQKPYELAATLLFIPDENNEVFFSINEILKSYIETRNNLTLGTLPNNIDFWTNFYIETAESYDDSDGYSFGTYTSSYTSDQGTFEGTAVNADLEFKNLYSGYMSEYLMANIINPGKFLTKFDIPVIFSTGYTDISFIQIYPSIDFIVAELRKQYYLNGVLVTTVLEAIPTTDEGVIRLEVTADCAYDRVDMAILIDSLVVSEVKQFKIDCNCSDQSIPISWLNNLGGFEPTWLFNAKADHIVEIQEAMTTKKNILPNWPKSYGSQADTIRKQTLRVSNKAYTVRSQLLTEAQVDAISYIKSSVLVQIINSRTDRRTVIVDTDSFVIRKDGDKTHEIAFNISFTDDIPVQTV